MVGAGYLQTTALQQVPGVVATAAPVFASVATDSGASSVNVVMTKPSGLAVGDLMIATWTTGASLVGDTVSTKPSSGWADAVKTFSTEGENLYWSWKVADSGDVAASTFTWVMSVARVWHSNLHRYTGVDTANPINKSSMKNDSAGTTHTTNAIWPNVDKALIVAYFTLGSGSAVWTLDASLTSRYNASLQSLPTAFGDVAQTTAASVSKTSTNSGSSNTSAMLILALAGAAGGVPPPSAAPRRTLLGVGI